MIYNFEPVKLRATKSGKCACGKRLTRSTTFEQTINPFNKNTKGEPKSYAEIMEELKAERSAWMQKSVEHDHPGYWGWSEGQKKEYDELGHTKVLMKCGFEVEIVKS